jgi:signal transduction histidine kinase
MAHRLKSSAAALAELVGDVLDVSRFDVGQVELQMSDFSLNDLLAEECARARTAAQTKNLTLTVEIPGHPIRLHSDRLKLMRTISNLVGNAIKFTDTGRVIVTSSVEQHQAVLIRVSDTGLGIPKDQLGRIFDECVQLANPGRDRSTGSGLGLAICRQLVEALGGSISVESQPGHGSQFTLRLPWSCVA